MATNPTIPLQRYLNAQVSDASGLIHPDAVALKPSLTISREAGARAISVSEHLTAYLTDLDETSSANGGWKVYEQTLVDQVIEEHQLPKEIEAHMPEDGAHFLDDVLREVLVAHPNDWTLFHHTVDTIRRLSRQGHAIIVGRGANFIATDLPNTFHVRLIGSLEKRIAHIQKKFAISPEEARAYVSQTDRARKRYVKSHLHRDIADPHFYHLVLNTDDLPIATLVRMIGDTLLQWAADTVR